MLRSKRKNKKVKASDVLSILAIAPGSGHAQAAEELFEQILGQEGCRLPADGRRAKRESVEEAGVEIPIDLYHKIVS